MERAIYLHQHVSHVHVTGSLREDLLEGLHIPGTPFGVSHGSCPCKQEGSVVMRCLPREDGLQLHCQGIFHLHPNPLKSWIQTSACTSETFRLIPMGTHNTFETGIATDHVGACGQAHLQHPLFPSITLFAFGGHCLVLSILLVNPTVCLICRK